MHVHWPFSKDVSLTTLGSVSDASVSVIRPKIRDAIWYKSAPHQVNGPILTVLLLSSCTGTME